jgi:hypothetical protein
MISKQTMLCGKFHVLMGIRQESGKTHGLVGASLQARLALETKWHCCWFEQQKASLEDCVIIQQAKGLCDKLHLFDGHSPLLWYFVAAKRVGRCMIFA